MVLQNTTDLVDALDDLMELRPFPAAASRIMSECERADVTANDIADIIRYDPALSMRILQVANSPLYGFSNQIRSVKHAAVVLGLRTVKDVAVSLAVGEVFNKGSAASVTLRRRLWSHSLACGCFAGILATRTEMCDSDEAFLAGILHDVGKLFLFDHLPDNCSGVFDENTRACVETEREIFGIDHASIGRRSGEHWGLPEDISEAIGFHHQPTAADFAAELVTTVAAANELAHVWLTQDDAAGEAAVEVFDRHGLEISPDDIEGLKNQSTTELNDVLEAYC